MADKVFALIGPVRFAFTTLDEPKAIMINGRATGDPVYGVTVFGPAEAFNEFNQVAMQAAAAKWPGVDLRQMFAGGGAVWPVTSGDAEVQKQAAQGRDVSHLSGKLVLKARTGFAPDVLFPDKRPVPQGQKNQIVYPGSVGYIHGEVVAYDGVGGGRPGIKLYLQNVMKSGDGDRLGGGMSAADAFAGIAGQATAINPAAGLPEMAAAPAVLPEAAPAPAPAPVPPAPPPPAAAPTAPTTAVSPPPMPWA